MVLPQLSVGNMMEVKLEGRGRIVIPSKVRKLLGLKEGSILTLEVKDGKILLIPKKKVSVDDLFGIAGIGEVEIEDVEGALAGEEIH